MSAALSIFDFEEQPVRILDQDGEPWFVAADVCRVLDLSNPRQAVVGLDDDEKITVSNSDGNPRAGVPHQYNLISESGLYTLVFKSRKPEAIRFRKWVTAEVLPALRQEGTYQMPGTESGLMEAMVDRLAGRMTSLFSEVMESMRDLQGRLEELEAREKVVPMPTAAVAGVAEAGRFTETGQLVVYRDPREEQLCHLLDTVLTGSRGTVRRISGRELMSVALNESVLEHVIPRDSDFEDKSIQAQWGFFLRKHLDGKCYTLSNGERWLAARLKPSRKSVYEFLKLSA